MLHVQRSENFWELFLSFHLVGVFLVDAAALGTKTGSSALQGTLQSRLGGLLSVTEEQYKIRQL